MVHKGRSPGPLVAAGAGIVWDTAGMGKDSKEGIGTGLNDNSRAMDCSKAETGVAGVLSGEEMGVKSRSQSGNSS